MIKRQLMLIMILCLLMVGCSDEEKGEFDIKGSVMDIRSGSILVEDEDSNLILVEIPEDGNINDYVVGQEVVIWTNGDLLESDPPQTNALHIEVITP